jgi:[acyl-carrier-protein] S-malonyltransferase
MAGLSLGEYTALHLAGWIAFDDALRLVARRGRLMQDAAERSSGGMVSLIGIGEDRVVELCNRAADGQPLVPANFNCPGQIVISGAKAACERAASLAEEFGGRAIPLTVAGAFHSPLMEPAVEGLKTALAAATIEKGGIGVVSNVSADYHADPDGVRALLCQQVAKPVRWQASIERLVGEGFDRFVEIGPGRVLTGLMRKINRAATALNFSNAASLDKIPA